MSAADEPPGGRLHGRCLCGGVRYAIEGPVGPPVLCHCRQCRRASGSAFAANASVPTERLHWLGGHDLVREFASSAQERRAFCSRCGSPLYARGVGRDDRVRIRLGGLEEDPGRRPVGHVYTGSKAPWWNLPDDGLPRAEASGPPDWTDVE